MAALGSNSRDVVAGASEFSHRRRGVASWLDWMFEACIPAGLFPAFCNEGPQMLTRYRTAAFALLAVTILTSGDLMAAKKKGAITKLTLDPDAPVVELFQGMKDKQLKATLILKDEKSGNMLIENLTKETLTVQFPESYVGIHAVNQFGLGGGGGGGGLGGQQGGGQGGQTQGGGGGGQQGGLGGGQGGGGGGGGFFSVPPEKVVRLKVNGVCLEYGKPHPSPRMEYLVFPVSHVTKDPVLTEVLNMVGTGRINQNAAQAAAWHLANGKSWRELATMVRRQPGADAPMFNVVELQGAQRLIAAATVRAEERKKKKAEKPAEPVRRDRTGRVVSQR